MKLHTKESSYKPLLIELETLDEAIALKTILGNISGSNNIIRPFINDLWIELDKHNIHSPGIKIIEQQMILKEGK